MLNCSIKIHGNRQPTFVTLTILMAFFVLFGVRSTGAQTDNAINLLGHFGGETSGIFVDGTTMYMGMGSALAIVDVSNPENPTLIGKNNPLSSYDIVDDIQLVDTIAYVANGNGLMMVDVSDPANPSVLSSVDTPGFARGLDVAEGIAYIADGENGLLIIDVNEPAYPEPLSSISTDPIQFGRFNMNDVVVVGNIAYIADENLGLVMIDVSDPINPAMIGLVEIGFGDNRNGISSIEVVGNIAYVVDHNRYVDSYAGLVTVDVSDPANPVIVGSIESEGARDVEVVGNVAYVSAGYHGMFTVDVSDPTNLTLIESVETGEGYYEFEDVVIAENIAYILNLTNRNNSIVMLDVSDPANFTHTGAVEMTGTLFGDVEVEDGVAYIMPSLSSKDRLTVDVTDPKNPIPLGMVNVSDPVDLLRMFNIQEGLYQDIITVGTIAYIHDSDNGLVMIDVSDPANPVQLSIIDPTQDDQFATSVTVANGIAYIGGVTFNNMDQNKGLIVTVDVSDPANPSLLGTFEIGIQVDDIAIVGNVAYVANWRDGIATLNVSNPASMTLIKTVDTFADYDIYIYGIDVVDDVIYVIGGGGGLYIFEFDSCMLTENSEAKCDAIVGGEQACDTADCTIPLAVTIRQNGAVENEHLLSVLATIFTLITTMVVVKRPNN